LPDEGDEVDPDSYPVCGEKSNYPAQIGEIIELECPETEEQYQYVIIQSTDAAAERLCLAEVGVYEPGQCTIR